MGRVGTALWWLTVALMVAGTKCQPAPPQLIKVGDSAGWKPNYNYTQWAFGKKFFVGYWLIFNFDKHMYTVFEVNQTSYENCNDKDFIKNITRGGRDVFNLTQARPYYFLGGGGYCWGGMKLAINVTDYVATAAPAPAPAKKNGVSTNSMERHVLMFVVAKVALVWALLSNMY